jgi:hypothetical protein
VPSLNLDQLRVFVAGVERGSFTAAAKELNLTQPAVTHQVQELERRFKVALVERFGKRAHKRVRSYRTCSKPSGRRFAHAGDDASVRRWAGRLTTSSHHQYPADPCACGRSRRRSTNPRTMPPLSWSRLNSQPMPHKQTSSSCEPDPLNVSPFGASLIFSGKTCGQTSSEQRSPPASPRLLALSQPNRLRSSSCPRVA